jgi:hypothetical protein
LRRADAGIEGEGHRGQQEAAAVHAGTVERMRAKINQPRGLLLASADGRSETKNQKAVTMPAADDECRRAGHRPGSSAATSPLHR